jgi:hypothetical protein
MILPSPNPLAGGTPMYKTLCAAILLFPMYVFAQETKPTAPFTTPQIVAKAKLTNQTAPITTTTILTPTQTGLYRLSIYATVTQNDPTSTSNWNVDVQWTDDSGQQQSVNSLLVASDNVLGQFIWENFFALGGTSVTLEAKVGTPITYSVTQCCSPDNSAYSLYYTLERLE